MKKRTFIAPEPLRRPPRLVVLSGQNFEVVLRSVELAP
jgi:hypothetical protein